MRSFSLLLLTLFLTNCCTKVDCDITIPNPVKIELKNFDYEDLKEAKAYLADKNTYTFIDSTSIQGSELWLDRYTFQDINELKDYNVVIRTKITSDTLYNISYDVIERKMRCNKCFLARDEDKQTTIANFSIEHKGVKYTPSETLIVTP